MESDTLHILWWLLGFSYFIHVVHAMVAIWDRVRAKPSYIERLNKKADQDDVDQALAALTRQVDTRLTGMHTSLKEHEKTNEALFRDIMHAIGRLEGRKP